MADTIGDIPCNYLLQMRYFFRSRQFVCYSDRYETVRVDRNWLSSQRVI